LTHVFTQGDAKLIRYKEYESAYEARETSGILKDNGQADLRIAMKELYEDFLLKQAQLLSDEDTSNELASNLVKLKTQMSQRQQTANRAASQMSNNKKSSNNNKDRLTENSTTSSKSMTK
jgi:hypothetical protein